MFTRQLDKKAIQNLVPNKYKLRFGDVNLSLNQREDIFPLHKDTVLLKEPRFYCLLLKCKRDETEPFTQRAVESVTTRGSKISFSHRKKGCGTCPP